MRHAETVTFGGSGFDRAAELRGDPKALQSLRERPDARAILLWRGKPLLTGEGRDQLARLPMDHPVVQSAARRHVFLGLPGGAPVFARDLSDWTPEDVDEAAIGAFLDPTEQRHPELPQDMVFAELRAVMLGLSPEDAELAATARAVLGWHDRHGFCAVCGAASDITMGGWQRTCPSCGAHHFPRTDPVVIMLITHGNEALLGRSPGWPEGMYSCLAGFVEPGETIEAAVRREVFEEAGVHVGEVSYLASQPWPFPASLMIGCHGRATSREITIDPAEIEDAQWVTRETIVATMAGEVTGFKPARRGAIAHFLLRNWLADTLD